MATGAQYGVKASIQLPDCPSKPTTTWLAGHEPSYIVGPTIPCGPSRPFGLVTTSKGPSPLTARSAQNASTVFSPWNIPPEVPRRPVITCPGMQPSVKSLPPVLGAYSMESAGSVSSMLSPDGPPPPPGAAPAAGAPPPSSPARPGGPPAPTTPPVPPGPPGPPAPPVPIIPPVPPVPVVPPAPPVPWLALPASRFGVGVGVDDEQPTIASSRYIGRERNTCMVHPPAARTHAVRWCLTRAPSAFVPGRRLRPQPQHESAARAEVDGRSRVMAHGEGGIGVTVGDEQRLGATGGATQRGRQGHLLVPRLAVDPRHVPDVAVAAGEHGQLARLAVDEA